jgi:hypothetical protein
LSFQFVNLFIFELQQDSLLSQLVIHFLIVTSYLWVTLDLLLGTLMASTDILNKLIDLLAVDIVVEALGRGLCQTLGRLG